MIFDQGDSLGVVKDILRHMRESGAARKLDASAILARISKWKNEGLTPEAVVDTAQFSLEGRAVRSSSKWTASETIFQIEVRSASLSHL